MYCTVLQSRHRPEDCQIHALHEDNIAYFLMEWELTLRISTRSRFKDPWVPTCTLLLNRPMTAPIEKTIPFALRDREASEPAVTQQRDASGNQTPNTLQPEPSSRPFLWLTPKRMVHVATNLQRYKATKRIIENRQLDGERHIIYRTVWRFPCLYKGYT